MKTSSHPRQNQGFTLVELLVVILIIAVLAALSMVGVNRLRASGDRASAMSVMRQLVIANTSYSVDHNGRYMPIAGRTEDNVLLEWYNDPKFRSYLTGDPADIEKSASELTTAPVGILDPVVVRAKKRYWDRLYASYGFNSTGLSWPASPTSPPMSYTMSQVENPSRTAFIASGTNYMVSYAGRNLWKSSPVEGKTTNDKMAFRHGNRAIVIYYDGSSGLVSMDDIARFDANGGINNPFWRAVR